MSYIVKCDNCGTTQDAECSMTCDPMLPYNPIKGEFWTHRHIPVEGRYKVIHACCMDCAYELGLRPLSKG